MNDVDRVITDEYERYKAEVLRTVGSKLGAAGVKLSQTDLEASYNEAWHAVYMKMAAGDEIENRVGFLVTVTHRRALSEYRASKAGLRADESELSTLGVEEDLDARMDAEIKIRHVVEGLRAGLSEREFEAATLCHLHGYTRPEAARAIGVKPKRMEKIMDGASSRIATVVERVQKGEHCDAMSSQIRAYAVGVLDPEGERYQQAQEHLSHCPACRREVWVMRGLAAAAPPIPAILAISAGSATSAGVAAKGAAGAAARPETAAGGSGGAGAGSGGGAGAAADAGGKAGLVAGVTASVAVAAVAAVGLATGVIGGGGSKDPEPPTVAASAGAGASSAADNAAAKAKAKAKARAKAAKAKAKARAAKRRAAAERAAQAAEIPVVAPPAEPVYVPPPEPVYVPPPEPPPAPDPKPQDPPTKPERPSKPTTDAGDEFGLR